MMGVLADPIARPYREQMALAHDFSKRALGCV